jgi:hypothetical protein
MSMIVMHHANPVKLCAGIVAFKLHVPAAGRQISLFR